MQNFKIDFFELLELAQENDAQRANDLSTLIIGVRHDNLNDVVFASLAELGGLIITGDSGTGKTKAMEALLYTAHENPEDYREVIIIDPRKDLLTNVCEDMPTSKWSSLPEVLEKICEDGESTMNTFRECGVDTIDEFNQTIAERRALRMIIAINDFDLLPSKMTDHEFWRVCKALRVIATQYKDAGIHLIINTTDVSPILLSIKKNCSVLALSQSPSSLQKAFSVSSKNTGDVIVEGEPFNQKLYQGEALFRMVGESTISPIYLPYLPEAFDK